MRDSALFARAVKKYFEPLAQEIDLRISQIDDGIYDIESVHFILRIRLDTGHRRGLNVTLRPASLKEFDENVPGGQYGIGCFVSLQGEDSRKLFIDVDSDQTLMKQTALLADASKRFLIPYLLGKKNDMDAVKEMVNTKTEQNSKS